ncbi:flavodoxin domain-containing protein [Paenibacillus sp. GCM10027627]|uniref:flavodoxin domain-containing protein n=1 Tax=unclassified Paenibacillus TaxID=185978 RepID=UPI00363C2961
MTTKAIYFYSLTGKTEAALDKVVDVRKVKLNKIDPNEFRFNDENVIVIGTPTYGRGAPPEYFLGILKQLRLLRGRKIGLFGSGNTVYGDDFCGALDVLEEMLKEKNEIIFKIKFEGYPSSEVQKCLSEQVKGEYR